MIGDCDCTPAQRNHPGHAGFHAALDELIRSNLIEIVGVDESGDVYGIPRRCPQRAR